MGASPRRSSAESGPSHRRVGRPPILDLERIVDAGVEIGLDRLSVVAVAKHLGVGGSSLYRHISGADELAEQVAERIMQGFEPPDLAGADLTAALTEFGLAIYDFVQLSPGFSRHVERIGPPPTMRVHIESFIGQVAGLGLGRNKAALALAEVASFADGWFVPEHAALPVDPNWDAVPEVASRMRTVSSASYFRWMLDLHIDGLLRALEADDLPWSRTKPVAN